MVGFMTVLSLLKVALRHHLGKIFSSDAAVIATVADLVLIAALFQISDGVQVPPANPLQIPNARSAWELTCCVFRYGDMGYNMGYMGVCASQAAVAGILRGMGRQKLVAGLNLVGFWVIGITVGSALAFGTEIGVSGLWWAPLCLPYLS